jgi:topoisomerase IA-like protein
MDKPITNGKIIITKQFSREGKEWFVGPRSVTVELARELIAEGLAKPDVGAKQTAKRERKKKAEKATPPPTN